jgi:alpha-glucuronidase
MTLTGDWVKVYTTIYLHKAAMVEDVLRDYGINCVQINKKDSSYISVGDIELYVSKENEFNSKQIIEDNNL